MVVDWTSFAPTQSVGKVKDVADKVAGRGPYNTKGNP
jgi:hypothetical protein